MANAVPASSRTVTPADNVRPPLLTLDQLKVDFEHVEKAVVDLETKVAAVPPVLEDDEDLEVLTEVATALIKAAKRCEEIRVEQNRPYLDASNLLNAHFKHDLTARLNAGKSTLEGISSTYLRKKAAREQAVRDVAAAAARKLAEEAAAKVTETVKAGNVPAVAVAVTQSNSLANFAAKASAAAAAPVSSMAKTTTSAGTASLVDNWTFEELDCDKIDLEKLRPFLARAAIEQALRGFIKSGRREIAGARIFNDNKPRFRG